MYFECNGKLYRQDDIGEIDLSNVESLEVEVLVKSPYVRHLKLEGIDAINFIHRCCPNALEGKKLKWLRHRWIIHNLIGHPLMQLLSIFRFYKTAIKVHDMTIPKPLIKKNPDLSGYDSLSGSLESFYGMETEGYKIWSFNRNNIYGAEEDSWDLMMELEDGDYLKIYEDSVTVWEGFVDKGIPYNHGARWWPKYLDKYKRLDWEYYFDNRLSATLYKKRGSVNV
jgi:hypothetical protein